MWLKAQNEMAGLWPHAAMGPVERMVRRHALVQRSDLQQRQYDDWNWQDKISYSRVGQGPILRLPNLLSRSSSFVGEKSI